MNKVSRLLGSATLATGLIFGGSTGVAFANDYDSRDGHGSYDNDHDNKDRDKKDRDNGRHDSDYRHNDHQYLHFCFYKWDEGRYVWADKDDDRKNCFIIFPYVRHY
jgi:hypothetical protein